MDKKYQVFISSTYTDLIEERKKVQNTILSMMQFPVGMELFSAADTKQWDVIKSTIDTSDYYVLIIGDKYGTVIETGTDMVTNDIITGSVEFKPYDGSTGLSSTKTIWRS